MKTVSKYSFGLNGLPYVTFYAKHGLLVLISKQYKPRQSGDCYARLVVTKEVTMTAMTQGLLMFRFRSPGMLHSVDR